MSLFVPFEQGACSDPDIDVAIFFKLDTRPAVRICNSCVIQQHCLQWAINNHNKLSAGVFGGMTHSQRQRLRSRNRAELREQQLPT